MNRIRGIPSDRRHSSSPYLPYWSQPTDGVMLLEDGSRLAMAKLHGKPHELCDADERNVGTELLNRIWRDVGGDDNVSICVHFIHDRVRHDCLPPRFRNDFSRKLWVAIHEALVKDKLFTNDWYISLIVSPRGAPFGGLRFRRSIARAAYRLHQTQDREIGDTSEIEGLWAQIAQNFAAYDVQRLGYRYNLTKYAKYCFSEIGEAMRRFIGINGAVPITTGRISDDIYTDTDQPIFERRIFRILGPGVDDDSDDAKGVRWGALFGLNNYMEQVGPDVLDEILTLPFPLVVSHHFLFESTPNAVTHLRRTRRQMKASKDVGLKEREGLKEAASDTQSREIARGEHDMSIAVYADTYPELIDNCSVARAKLVSTGAQIVEETGGNMAQFFGQLPGNFRYCGHPGKIGTRDFAMMANFGAFPRGSKVCKWGPETMTLPTTAGTAYDFVPFVGEVGMQAWFGLTGSGKTVAVLTMLALMDQYMVDNNGLILIHDKDDGCRICVEHLGGNYLAFNYGSDSGMMPLRGFKEDTPYARTCLTRLLRSMVLRDGLGPIPAQDNDWINRGAIAQLRLPLHMRSFWGWRQFLGWDDPLGAGPRLERWCRGNEMGWLFDGEDDLVDFDAPVVAFNMGRILKDPDALPLTRQYLADREDPVTDGRRTVAFFDEAKDTVGEEHASRWRTGRKLNEMAILATQQPEDFLSTPWGRGILDQCFTMGFFATPGASNSKRIYCGNEEEGGLGLTDGEFEAITTRLKAHQFLLKRRGINAESVICNFDLSGIDPSFMHVLSATTNRVKLWNELKAKFPDAQAAFSELSHTAVD